MIRVRHMPKWPWGQVLKEMAPDRFPLAVFCFFFPHRFLPCQRFQHCVTGVARGKLLWVPRTGSWLCATMLSSSITPSSKSYSLWLFCLFLCCSATHTRATEGKVTVDFKINDCQHKRSLLLNHFWTFKPHSRSFTVIWILFSICPLLSPSRTEAVELFSKQQHATVIHILGRRNRHDLWHADPQNRTQRHCLLCRSTAFIVGSPARDFSLYCLVQACHIMVDTPVG